MAQQRLLLNLPARSGRFAELPESPELWYRFLDLMEEHEGDSGDPYALLDVAMMLTEEINGPLEESEEPPETRERIPLAARLMAVADTYDGLISQRVYKQAHSHDEAVAILQARRGTHFDPDIIDAFLEVQADFQGIAKRFADTPIDEAAEAERVRLILG